MASTYERMHDYDRALEHRQTYMSLVGAVAADVAEFGTIGRRSGYNAALRFFARRSAAATEQRGYLTSSELAYVFAVTGGTRHGDRLVETGGRRPRARPDLSEGGARVRCLAR